MAVLKVIAIGDSVVWGQGLRHEDKFASLFYRRLTGAPWPPEDLRAHSGAIMGIYTAAQAIPSGLSGITDPQAQHEVPLDAPTTLEQIRAVDDAEGRQTDVMILNGGINDVKVNTILFDNLLASEQTLEATIRAHCYDEMNLLLREARAKFPQAALLVLGYYPMLSAQSGFDQSNADKVKAFLMLRMLFPIPLTDLLVGKAARSAMYFHLRQLYWLRRAVAEANQDARLRGRGILFIHPAFAPQNSVGAGEAFLFEPKPPPSIDVWAQNLLKASESGDWDLFLIQLAQVDPQAPDDPIAQKRRMGCDAAFGDDLSLRVRCRIAAVGHPNVAGAQRYATALWEKYAQHKQIRLKEHLWRLTEGNGPISVRAALERYRLDLGKGLRASMQYMTVDCIQVTITTKSTALAGTDDDVFFSVGDGRRWLLNQDILALDTADDFEAGSTGTYTIDPAMDTARGPLYLGDIKEIRLAKEKESAFGIAGDWWLERIAVEINGLEVLRSIIDVELTADSPTWVAVTPSYPRHG